MKRRRATTKTTATAARWKNRSKPTLLLPRLRLGLAWMMVPRGPKAREEGGLFFWYCTSQQWREQEDFVCVQRFNSMKNEFMHVLHLATQTLDFCKSEKKTQFFRVTRTKVRVYFTVIVNNMNHGFRRNKSDKQEQQTGGEKIIFLAATSWLDHKFVLVSFLLLRPQNCPTCIVSSWRIIWNFLCWMVYHEVVFARQRNLRGSISLLLSALLQKLRKKGDLHKAVREFRIGGGAKDRNENFPCLFFGLLRTLFFPHDLPSNKNLTFFPSLLQRWEKKKTNFVHNNEALLSFLGWCVRKTFVFSLVYFDSFFLNCFSFSFFQVRHTKTLNNNNNNWCWSLLNGPQKMTSFPPWRLRLFVFFSHINHAALIYRRKAR